MFAAGFLLRTVWDASVTDSVQVGSGTNPAVQGSPSSSQGHIVAQESDSSSEKASRQEDALTAEMIQVRIDDGQVQWYDGTLWHNVASVEELAEEDKFYLAQDPFLAFSQELQQENAEGSVESWQTGTFMAEENGLLVGQKETPKPAAKPKAPSQPSPEETPAPQEPVDTPPADNSQISTPSYNPPPSAPAPSTPAPSTPTDTGDGENMEWTDDYL